MGVGVTRVGIPASPSAERGRQRQTSVMSGSAQSPLSIASEGGSVSVGEGGASEGGGEGGGGRRV